MAELTLEQKRALALANARKRQAGASGAAKAADAEGGGVLDYLKTAADLANRANPATYIGTSLAKSLVKDATSDEKTDARDNTMGKIDSVVRGAADTLSFGLADELAAGGDTLVNGDEYAKNLAKERAIDKVDAENRFEQRLTGQLAGGVTQGAGLIARGISPTAKAITAGKTLPKVMTAGALEGGTLGALQGLGSGEGTSDRVEKAAIGTFAGGALGGAIPAVSSLVEALATPVMSRLRPEAATDKIMAALMRRSDMTADDISARLAAAQADDQGMYTVADTLGVPGQRILSTAARTPTDARKPIIDALVDRQMGQGDRLGRFLAEGFDASDTAAQRVASLTKARDAAANADYGALRAKVGDTPIWDDDLQALTSRPSVQRAINDAKNIAAERGYQVTNPFQIADDGTLSLPEGTAPNFTFWDTVKRGLDRQIATDPTNRDLVGTKNALTKILDDSVDGYAAAREPFMKASRAIDAVDLGKKAASSRMRSDDTIPAFQAMSPEEQAAFRAGYVDPRIAQIEAASVSPTTNKARPLMSSKTGDEFQAFAVDGQADRLGDRIAREQRMFETSNAAMGGSKTADNLADMADSAIDPGFIAALARGSVKDAALSAITKAANSARGLPPSVIEKLAPALMETNPEAARALFTKSRAMQQLSDQTRAKIIEALMSSGAAIPSRLSP